ncbi:glycerophosphodiester phosphodiesterase [Anaerolineae bacterium CFX9]|nr:glycerophosphodiester phosphodiesterase [Anaerolineae bacterium CFX9]
MSFVWSLIMRKALRILGGIIVGIILIAGAVYLFMVARAAPMPDHPWFRAEDPAVLVIAHQGGDGERPGNTMSAFRHAVEIGADVLEMDVHSTADGVLVTIHDDTVDRTTNGTGRVNDMTFAELQALDAGYHWPTLAEESDRDDRPFRGQGITIPALDDVLSAFPQMRYVIEIKQETPSIVQPLCDLLRRHNLQEATIVASFRPAVMYDFRQRCPEVATSAVEEEIRPFFFLTMAGLHRAYVPQAHALQVPEYAAGFQVVTPAFISAAHHHNIAVQPWTINDAETMQRMIDIRVDGLITDYPSLLLELLDRGTGA